MGLATEINALHTIAFLSHPRRPVFFLMAKSKIKGLSKEEQGRRKKAAIERMAAAEDQAGTAAETRLTPTAEGRAGERGAAEDP